MGFFNLFVFFTFFLLTNFAFSVIYLFHFTSSLLIPPGSQNKAQV